MSYCRFHQHDLIKVSTNPAAAHGDKGYDADRLRRLVREAGEAPVIPGRRNRRRTIQYDEEGYRNRYLIENAFCRLKDFRRVHTRYDKLAANFLSAVALATAVAFRF